MMHETATKATRVTGAGGQKHRRPVGGEDRAPACQKRLGETEPTGETGPFSRRLGALADSGLRKWGGMMGNKAAISACPQRQKCMLRSGTNCNSLMPR